VGPASEEHLYGINSVQAALRARRRALHMLWLKQGELSPRLRELEVLASSAGVPVKLAANEDLEMLCHSRNHQGAVLACGALPPMEVRALLDTTAPDGGWPLLVALDQVSDPRNLGAVVRSAKAFGARAVIVPRHQQAPASPAASSTSAGALEDFPLAEVANLARFLGEARKAGWWVAGAAADGGKGLDTVVPGQPLVLVLGNEAKGLRTLVEKNCDFLLTLHLPGGGSLNVSAAASVLLYGLRQRMVQSA